MEKTNFQQELGEQSSEGTSDGKSSTGQHLEDSGLYSVGNSSDPSTSCTSEEALQFLMIASEENFSCTNFCSQVLNDQHLFKEELYLSDPSQPIEREAVEAKLGRIILRRVFSSSSLDFVAAKPYVYHRGPPVKASKSWSDFGKWTKQTRGHFKRNLSLADSDSFNKACEIYKMIIKWPNRDLQERFALAEYLLPKYYPNYWKYLNQSYRLQPNPDLFLEEVECKYKIIRACKNLLQEEERYFKHSFDIIGKRRRIPIKGKLCTLNRDFQIAGAFIKFEYPDVFAYLIQKYEFAKFLMDRLTVEKNKLLVIESSIQPLQKLIELEAEYSTPPEATVA